MHDSQIDDEYRKSQPNVIDISEEVYVSVVLVEVRTGIVVQLRGQSALPLTWVNRDVLVLGLTETRQHLPQQ